MPAFRLKPWSGYFAHSPLLCITYHTYSIDINAHGAIIAPPDVRCLLAPRSYCFVLFCLFVPSADFYSCPAVLKDQVCSPGGLTIAAIESLEKDGFRAAAMSAVITVASKSIEMREGGIK